MAVMMALDAKARFAAAGRKVLPLRYTPLRMTEKESQTASGLTLLKTERYTPLRIDRERTPGLPGRKRCRQW